MRRFFTPLENHPSETRASLAPATVAKLKALGFDVLVQARAGLKSDFSDADYEAAGATIVPDAASGYEQADIVARVRKPEPGEIDKMRPGTLHLSFLDPFNEKPLIEALAARRIDANSRSVRSATGSVRSCDQPPRQYWVKATPRMRPSPSAPAR